MWGNLVEEKIREAMDAGEFNDLPGKGKPLDLNDYFNAPAELRLGYSMLKSAHCLPEEVELRKEIEMLKGRLENCANQHQRQSLKAQIESRQLKLNLLSDSNRRQRNQKA